MGSSAWAELSRGAATARSIVDECTLALGKALDEFEGDLQEHGEETISAFEVFGAGVVEQLASDGQLAHLQWIAASDKQNRKMAEFLGELTERFEFWIKEEKYDHRPQGYVVLLD